LASLEAVGVAAVAELAAASAAAIAALALAIAAASPCAAAGVPDASSLVFFLQPCAVLSASSAPSASVQRDPMSFLRRSLLVGS
jgi:hypothetical protein